MPISPWLRQAVSVPPLHVLRVLAVVLVLALATPAAAQQVLFATTSTTIAEDSTTLTILVRLATPAPLPAPASVTVSDLQFGSATSGLDYAAFSPQVLTFPPGSTSTLVPVQVTIVDDFLMESDETIVLRLTNTTGPIVVDHPNQHLITIQDNDAGATVAFDQSASTTAEPGAHLVPIRLQTASPLAASVSVEVIDLGSGSATSGSDYVALGTQVVTFAAGATDGSTQDVVINILDDPTTEAPETIALALASVTGPAATVAPKNHTVTVNDNDFSLSVLTFDSASSTATESETVSILVRLGAAFPLSTPITVQVQDAGTGSATSGVDYATFPVQALTFPAGSPDGTTLSVDVEVFDDLEVDPGETVVLQLFGTMGPAIISAPNLHTITIADDTSAPVLVRFDSSSSLTAESGVHAISLVLETTLPLSQAASVTVTDSGGGTAIAGSDYAEFLPVVVTFPAGATHGASELVTLTLTDDLLFEGDETIEMALGMPAGAEIITPASHTVTLQDDEAVSVSWQPATTVIDEDAAEAEVQAVLVTGPGVTLAVPVLASWTDTGTGSATAGADYDLPGTGTISFSIGAGNGELETLIVPVLDDLLLEGTESIALELVSGTPTGVSLGDTPQEVVIADDEVAMFSFVSTGSTVPEQDGVHLVDVQLLLPGATTLATPVSVSVIDTETGSATVGVDYLALPSTTLTFPIGSGTGAIQSVGVSLLDNDLASADQTIEVALSTPTGPGTSLGSPTSHVVTISDNDGASVSFTTPSSLADELFGASTMDVVLAVPSEGTLASPVVVALTNAGTGTATLGADYLLGSGQIVFPAGSGDGSVQPAPFQVVADLLVEGDESATLLISVVSGPAALGSQAQHDVTIEDEDSVVVAFSTDSSTIPENALSHTVVAELFGQPGVELAIPLHVEVVDLLIGDATAGTDYTEFGSQLLTFASGSSVGASTPVTLEPLDDTALEGVESVFLALTQPSDPELILGSPAEHEVNLIDDEQTTMVVALGFAHEANAGTHLDDSDPSTLQIVRAGDSGPTGVGIHLGQVAESFAHDILIDPGDVAGTTSGSTTFFGSVDGVANQLLGTWSLALSPGPSGTVTLSPDFSALMPAEVTVQVFSDTTPLQGATSATSVTFDLASRWTTRVTRVAGTPPDLLVELSFPETTVGVDLDGMTVGTGNRIVWSILAPLGTIDSVSRIDWQFQELPTFALTSEAVTVFGFVHTALGPVQLQPIPNLLSVIGTSPSGDDGVAVTLPATSGKFAVATSLTTSSFATGNQFRVAGQGTVNGMAETTVGELCLERVAAELELTPEFPPIGAPTYTLELRLSGSSVFLDSGRTGPAIFFDPTQPLGFRVGANPASPYRVDVEVLLGAPVEISVVGGVTVMADHVVVTSDDAVDGFSALEEVELLGTALPNFTITSEEILQPPHFRRGDANGDGAVDIGDAIATLQQTFGQMPEGTCQDARDSNDDGQLNIADGVYVLGTLFGDGPPAPAPGMSDCGPDPTSDALGCEAYACD